MVNRTTDIRLSNIHYIDSLIYRVKWGGSTGTGVVLTYNFYDGVHRSGFNDNDTDLVQLSDVQENATSNVLHTTWSTVANITFVRVNDAESADIRFSGFPALGNSYFPGEGSEGSTGTRFGMGVLNQWINNLGTAKGTYEHSAVIMHEIGHALGLKHPDAPEGYSIVADLSIDTTLYSVMSYRSYQGQPLDAGYSQWFYGTTPMLHDIAAIQHIYGPNMSANAGDDFYNWARLTEGRNQILMTIWDAGGTDTIDWSDQNLPAVINLNNGQWSQLGPAYWNGVAWEPRTLAIAYEVRNSSGVVINIIENAIGGSGNDTIIGNFYTNVFSGGDGNDQIFGSSLYFTTEFSDGNDILFGDDGDDYLHGGSGDDFLDGGTGNDTLNGGSGRDRLSGEDGDDQLFGDRDDDWLNGGIGNDSLDGGVGNDQMYGGVGSDTYQVDSIADVIIEYANAGIDTVYASIDYSLGENLENLTLYGTPYYGSARFGYGNSLNNHIIGNIYDNYLLGALGNDTLSGGDGNDILYGDYAEQTYQGRLYLLSAPGTWNKAQAEAQSLGGNLVTINDSLEQQWLAQTFGTSELLWIGLNDFVQEGTWQWVSGEPLTYQNWADGEPNNSDPANPLGEDYVVMGWDGSRWNDLGSGWRTFRGIIELSNIAYAEFNRRTAGNDVLDGGAGNDFLFGGAGNDTLNGGTGDDVLVGGAGIDQLDGGDGIDTADLSDIAIGVIANLAAGTFSYPNELGVAITEVIRNIENLIGTQFNDNLIGNQAANRLEGGAGNDTLSGGNGNDTLLGGAGNDLLSGGNGIDFVDGGDGFDRLRLEEIQFGVKVDLNTDTMTYRDAIGNLVTETFRNIEGVIGGQFDDELIGHVSNGSTLDSRGGNDTLRGGSGNDDLSGGNGNDTLFGGAGNDLLAGGNGIDFVDGGDGFDWLRLEELQFGVRVDLNTDTMTYQDATGNLVTETFRNIEGVIGGQFDDELIGHVSNNSSLEGRGGNDTLRGGAGNDQLSGGDGDDTLLGGAGNDWLAGGDGIDFLDGGDGFDLALLGDLPSGVRADLNTNQMTYQDIAGNIITEIIRNIEGITSGKFNDELIGDAGNNRFDGRGGNDTLRGGLGDDYFLGGDGIDFIDGGDGFDTVNLIEDFNFGVVANLDAGTLIYTNAAGNTVAETILNIESVIATQFNDSVIGNNANNVLYGFGGNDRLFGGAGNDQLIGGDGDDVLVGGSGSLNTLSGNAGSDIFVLASDGFSQALDFELGIDKVGLSGNLTANQLKIEQGTGVNSSSTWIKLVSDNTNLMLLNGVQASALTTAMFLPASSYQSSLLV